MRGLKFRPSSTVTIVIILVLGLLPFAIPASATASGWGVPARIGTRNWTESFSPDVAVDAEGNAIAVWGQTDGTDWGVWASRYAPHFGWWGEEQIGEGEPGGWEAPHVAVDPNGGFVAVWSRNGSVWASHLLGSGLTYHTWSTPSPVQGNGGYANQPQVAMDPAGRALVAWSEFDGNRTNIWAGWFAPQQGWGERTVLGEGSGGCFASPSTQVAVSRAGNAVVIWCGNDTLMANSFAPSVGWGVPIQFGRCPAWPRLVMSPAGSGFVVWQGWGFDGQCGGRGASPPLWARSFTAAGVWGLAVQGPNGEVPAVAVEPSGNATVVWWGSWDTGEGIWTSRFTPDAGWGSRTLIANAKIASFAYLEDVPPSLAFDQVGRALAVWTDGTSVTNDPKQEVRLVASRFVPGLGWGAPIPISTAWGFQQDVAIDSLGNAIVVWRGIKIEEPTASFYHTGIWANRFVPYPDQTAPADPIGLALEGFARLTAIVQGLFILLVASVAALAFLMIRSARRGRSGSVRVGEPTAPLTRPSVASEISPLPAQEIRGETIATFPRTTQIRAAARRRGTEHRPAIASIRLTAKERILLHLVRYDRFADELEVPADLTQDGIATAAWIDQRHFAQYIGPLERDGLVTERIAHVRNGRQRRRVYELTDNGRRIASRLQARAKSEVVQVWDGENTWDVTVGEILAKLKGKISVLDVARHLAEAGVVDFAELEADREGPSLKPEGSGPESPPDGGN